MKNKWVQALFLFSPLFIGPSLSAEIKFPVYIDSLSLYERAKTKADRGEIKEALKNYEELLEKPLQLKESLVPSPDIFNLDSEAYESLYFVVLRDLRNLWGKNQRSPEIKNHLLFSDLHSHFLKSEKQGDKYFEAGSFVEAAQSYEEAYLLLWTATHSAKLSFCSKLLLIYKNLDWKEKFNAVWENKVLSHKDDTYIETMKKKIEIPNVPIKPVVEIIHKPSRNLENKIRLLLLQKHEEKNGVERIDDLKKIDPTLSESFIVSSIVYTDREMETVIQDSTHKKLYYVAFDKKSEQLVIENELALLEYPCNPREKIIMVRGDDWRVINGPTFLDHLTQQWQLPNRLPNREKYELSFHENERILTTELGTFVIHPEKYVIRFTKSH